MVVGGEKMTEIKKRIDEIDQELKESRKQKKKMKFSPVLKV